MPRLTTIIIIMLILFAPNAVHADKIDTYVQAQMQGLHIPGLSLAVVKDGKVVKTSGYGLANVETDTPATPETVYKIASLSKQFLATAVMLLVQDRKLSLDDKAAPYLDGAPESWKEITIRQLLTHTSGIVRDASGYDPFKPQPNIDVIKSAYAEPLGFKPGDKWAYSNVGYYAIAEIISKVSGKRWDEFIAERIFKPAGMTSTRTTSVDDIVPHRASGYDRDENRLENAFNPIALRPSGAFLSTVLDLAKWDQALSSNSVLTASSRAQMWTPVTLNDKTAGPYGFGWFIDSFQGHSRIHHDGGLPGFQADFERFEDEGITVIVLANSSESSLKSIAINVAGLYNHDLAPPPFKLSATVSSASVGIGAPVTITVTVKDAGQAAPHCVLDMEILDLSGQSVNKEFKTDESFAAGEMKTYTFSWTPKAAGEFTVSLGAFGPNWVPTYAWQAAAATITVH